MTIRISAKCDDRCFVVVRDDEGAVVKQTDGYVPRLLSPSCDYVDFEIDLATGKLVNWRPPSEEQLQEYLQS